MDAFRQFLFRLRALFRRGKLEAEMRAELQQHLELSAAAKIASGMSEAEARTAAQQEFGGTEQAKESCREGFIFSALEQFVQDLRQAFRSLGRARVFSAVVVATLAVGLGTVTAMFFFYSSALLRPMAFLHDENSLLRIRCYQTKAPGDDFNVSLPDLRDVASQAKSLTTVFAAWNRTFVVAGDERAERAVGAALTATSFDALGVQPLLGRSFQVDDAKPGAPAVVLLSYHLWQNAYGGRAEIIGQSITVNMVPAIVVGVMPKGFGFPVNSALWQPLSDNADAGNGSRARRGMFAYARMAPNFALAQVQAELDAIALRLERDHPQSNTGLRFRAFRIHDEATRSEKPMLQLLLGGAAVLFLIAIGNVANLLLARGAARAHERSVRAALGATRIRVMRHAMSEAWVLGLSGGAASVVIAGWEISILRRLTPTEPPYWMRFDLDWRTIAFAVAASLVTVVVIGIFPALQSLTTGGSAELKSGRGQTGGRKAARIRSILVVLQCALAVVLLVPGALLTRSFVHLAQANLGLDPEHVLTFRTGMPDSADRDAQKTIRFYEAIEDNLRAVPGVQAVGFMSFLPLKTNSRSDAIVIEGRPPLLPGARQFALVRGASPGAFEALRLQLRSGRFFDVNDRHGRPRVAVVDEAFVEKYFPGENPVGRRIAFDQPNSKTPPSIWYTIVGVVGQTKQHATARAAEPNIWTAMTQEPDNFMDGAVRVQGDPVAFTSVIHAAVRAARADTPVFAIVPMTKVVRDAIGQERLFGGLFASFAAIALFLASIGLYGVIAYSVVQRTREIGVRLALGARPSAIGAMILAQGARVVGIGMALGLVGAWLLSSAMSGALHGVSAHDIATFAGVSLLVLTTASLACSLPARRATRIDPAIALRSE